MTEEAKNKVKIISDYEGTCPKCGKDIKRHEDRCVEQKNGDTLCINCHLTERIIPQDDNLFIILEDRAVQIGAVVVPDKHSERTEMATVQSVGDKDNNFVAGDKVIFTFFNGVHIHIPETYTKPYMYRIIREDEILARWNPEE